MTSLTIMVPRVGGSERMARELCSDVQKGTPTVLDFRDAANSSPKFVECLLFYATVPPANRNVVVVANACQDVIDVVDSWLDKSAAAVSRAVVIANLLPPMKELEDDYED